MARLILNMGLPLAAFLLLCGAVLRGDEQGDRSWAESNVSDVNATEFCEATCCDCWDNQGGCDLRWSVTADVLFLARRDPTAAELVFNQADPGQSLDAADFDFGLATGVDVSAVGQLSACNGIEVRCFGLGSWSSDTSVTTTLGDPLQINTDPPLITQAGNSVDASYRSDLVNFEINARRQLSDWLTLLAGFRYLELDEQFRATLPGAAVPLDYEAVTRNRLYGAQLGGQALLWGGCGKLNIEAAGKAGIYGNPAAQNSFFATDLVTVGAGGKESVTAFIGEVGLSADYRLSDRISVRGGYRLLWVDGVALATDQVAVSNLIAGDGLDTTGDAFYHGAFVGLQCGW